MSHPFGSLFPEMLTKGQKKMRHHQALISEYTNSSTSRFIFFIAVFIAGLGLLLARLFLLTVVEGNRFRQLAQTNRIREVKIAAPRGIIYDRNGIALVRNIPGKTSVSVSSISDGSAEGVAREYIFGEIFSHLLGFTGEINEEELKSQKSDHNITYTLGDIVGKMGIEKNYDALLRGIDGKELVEVDALGNKMRVLGQIESVAGNNLTVTADSSLQKIASQELAGKKGAIIVTNPNNGEILALYSAPSFDPNRFITGENIAEILEDPHLSLFNRAISGVYPPGSTFKIITAIAALEDKIIDKNTKFEDVGILKVGDYTYGNWYFTQYGKKEGWLNIVDAIRRSNDIFFYKTGELVGIDRLSFWARKLGVGSLLGIDIEGEEKGVMPDPLWREKTLGERWYLGNTYHVAIGQGDLLTTPLGVNAWTNVVGSGGKLCRPHLVKSQGKSQSEECKDLGIKKETIDLIREGMREACSTGGTGWPLFKFKVKNDKLKIDNVDFFEPTEASGSGKNWIEIPLACKTGTAEYADPVGRTHAWITLFAPVVHPQISVTVLVEGGGEGSSVGGPIAKKILEEWFTQEE